MHPGIGGKRLAAPRGGRDAVRAVRRAGINPRILGRSCREPRRKQGFGMRQWSPDHESAKDEWASDKSAAVMRKQCHAISRRKMNPVDWAACGRRILAQNHVWCEMRNFMEGHVHTRFSAGSVVESPAVASVTKNLSAPEVGAAGVRGGLRPVRFGRTAGSADLGYAILCAFPALGGAARSCSLVGRRRACLRLLVAGAADAPLPVSICRHCFCRVT